MKMFYTALLLLPLVTAHGVEDSKMMMQLLMKNLQGQQGQPGWDMQQNQKDCDTQEGWDMQRNQKDRDTQQGLDTEMMMQLLTKDQQGWDMPRNQKDSDTHKGMGDENPQMMMMMMQTLMKNLQDQQGKQGWDMQGNQKDWDNQQGMNKEWWEDDDQDSHECDGKEGQQEEKVKDLMEMWQKKQTMMKMFGLMDVMKGNKMKEQPKVDICEGKGSLGHRFRLNNDVNDQDGNGVATGLEFYADFLENYDMNKDGCCSVEEWVNRWTSYFKFSEEYVKQRMSDIGGKMNETCAIRYGPYNDPNITLDMDTFLKQNLQSLIDMCRSKPALYMSNCDCYQLAGACRIDTLLSANQACKDYIMVTKW